ncbi:unnamed protein product, partial [Mesorhabditis spiculigera]
MKIGIQPQPIPAAPELAEFEVNVMELGPEEQADQSNRGAGRPQKEGEPGRCANCRAKANDVIEGSDKVIVLDRTYGPLSCQGCKEKYRKAVRRLPTVKNCELRQCDKERCTPHAVEKMEAIGFQRGLLPRENKQKIRRRTPSN